MMAATALADWVAKTPWIDGVLFGSSDGETAGPPICAVAVAGQRRGYGKGETQSRALASAVGELLEQVAASRVDWKRLRFATFAEIAVEAFDPRWLGLYSPEQYARADFPFRPFDVHEPLHWIQGFWLDTHESVYLPAFAVYLSDQLAGEAICQVTSNGLGAAESLAAAVDHAALELFERDAFLLSWLALLPKTKVAGDYAGILSDLESRGAETELYLVSQSPVCAALAVAIGDGIDWPAVTLGLGAGRNSHDAREKAILELGQTAPYLAKLWQRGERQVRGAQDIKTLQDHALYYCDPAHRIEFERWRSTAVGLPHVEYSAVRLAAVEITTPELTDSPYRIARVLGRGLQPIHCGYGFERLPCERLLHVLGTHGPNSAPVPLL